MLNRIVIREIPLMDIDIFMRQNVFLINNVRINVVPCMSMAHEQTKITYHISIILTLAQIFDNRITVFN